MKKINLSVITVILLCLFSFSIKAQKSSVPTIIVNDKVDEAYFKNKKEFVATIKGYATETEVKSLCTSISNNEMVEKCEIISTDGRGNYDVKISVKRPQEFAFYRNIAVKNNITRAIVNGEEKSLLQK